MLFGGLLRAGAAVVAAMDGLLVAGMKKSVPTQILTVFVVILAICSAVIFSYSLFGSGVGLPSKAVRHLNDVKVGLFLLIILPVIGTLCCLFRTSWPGGDFFSVHRAHVSVYRAELRRDPLFIVLLWHANVIVGRELGPSFALILLAVIGTLIVLYRLVFYRRQPPDRRRHLYLVDITVSLAAVFWVIPAAQWEILLRSRLGAGG